MEVIRALQRARGGASPDLLDNNGWTPLVLAMFYGRMQVVDELESAGAQLDVDTNIQVEPVEGLPPGTTLLHWASFRVGFVLAVICAALVGAILVFMLLTWLRVRCGRLLLIMVSEK